PPTLCNSFGYCLFSFLLLQFPLQSFHLKLRICQFLKKLFAFESFNVVYFQRTPRRPFITKLWEGQRRGRRVGGWWLKERFSLDKRKGRGVNWCKWRMFWELGR